MAYFDTTVLMMDDDDPDEFYVIGQFEYVASIIKFRKYNGHIQWKLDLTDLTEIEDAVPDDSGQHIYGCGHDISTTPSPVGFFRVKSTGDLKRYSKISGDGQNLCAGVAFDSGAGEAYVLIMSASTEFKPTASTTYSDVILLKFSDSGRYTSGRFISMKSDVTLGRGIRLFQNFKIFGGSIKSFQTKF